MRAENRVGRGVDPRKLLMGHLRTAFGRTRMSIYSIPGLVYLKKLGRWAVGDSRETEHLSPECPLTILPT